MCLIERQHKYVNINLIYDLIVTKNPYYDMKNLPRGFCIIIKGEKNIKRR